MKLKKLKKNKFGIIGYGSIGKVHKNNLVKLGYEVLIYDPNINKKEFAKNLQEVVDQCFAVIISSPSNTHLKYLDYFVKKGKHIFIEKPFSHELNKTKKILKIANSKKILIAVNYNLRVRSSVLLLKKLLLKIKKIYWANFNMSSNVLAWRKNYSFKKNYTQSKIAGGIIYDSIHEIDLNNFLFGNVKFINSYNFNYNRKIFKNSSYSNINLKINKSFCSTIQLDYQGHPDQRKIKILTEKGLIHVDIKKNIVEITDKFNKINFRKKFNKNKNIDYKIMLSNFIECMNKKSIKPICSAKEALKNIELAIKANEK